MKLVVSWLLNKQVAAELGNKRGHGQSPSWSGDTKNAGGYFGGSGQDI